MTEMTGKVNRLPNPDPNKQRRGDFYARLEHFGAEARTFISSLSNVLLENDIRNKYSQPDYLKDIVSRLISFGLSEDDTKATLDFLELPHPQDLDTNGDNNPRIQ